MNLFVEMAAPTALALSCPRIATEMIRGEHWLSERRDARFARRGVELWNAKEIEDLGAKHDWDEQLLLKAMGPDTLYIHPIKLTRWRPAASRVAS
jgi:hypothetical protein